MQTIPAPMPRTTGPERSRSPLDQRVIRLVADLLITGVALERRVTTWGRTNGPFSGFVSGPGSAAPRWPER